MRKFPAALVLMAAPLMAEEGGDKPKLSPVWDWLNFIILAVSLGYLMAKYLGPMLVARSQQIHEGLAAGEKASEAEAEFARIRQHAQQEIESAGKLARLEVQRFAAKVAIDLAEQKVRARMSAEKQIELLNQFIGEIAGSTAHLG
jgi:F0F1-type ATP synthase membrane subunit b/b'